MNNMMERSDLNGRVVDMILADAEELRFANNKKRIYYFL